MGTLSAPFWCLYQKLSLSPLYFNKTLVHKSSEQSRIVSGPGLNSSPPEAKNPGVLSFSNNLLKCWGQMAWSYFSVSVKHFYKSKRYDGTESGSESLVAQLCLTLCNPMDCSLPGSSVHGIFQARVLEWVAISFSRGSSWPRDRTWVFHIIGRHFTIWATREVLSPEINVFLEPQNVILFGNRVFVNVIKSRIHMKPYIIRVASKSNKNVLIRDRKGYMEKQGRKPCESPYDD